MKIVIEGFGPQRFSMLLWQVRWDRLKVNILMMKRGIRTDPWCEVCRDAEKSCIHVLRDYLKVARLCRCLIPCNYWLDLSKEHGIKDWLDWNLPQRWQLSFIEGK